MMELVKGFWTEEDGLGTVEIVLLIAVLVALALIFRRAIIAFLQGILGNITDAGDEFEID